MFKWFKNRQIKKAISKWQPKQTQAQLVHIIANELVESLEKAGLSPKEIDAAISANNKFIVEAVNHGAKLMVMCDSIKDTVLAKNAAIDSIKEIVLEKVEEQPSVKDRISKVYQDVKGVFSKEKSIDENQVTVPA